MKEVTLRQIAEAAGTSLTTVSFALRNSPKVSPAKRALIKETAERLGYRPNPLVTAAMSRMRAARPVNYQATLGWVNDHPEADWWRKDPRFRGAVVRANELGYAIDEFHLDEIRIEEPAANVRRFCQISRARGIHGLILPELDRAHHAQEEWPDLAVVVIGRVSSALHTSRIKGRLLYSPLHSVNTDIFINMRIAMDALRERGYQRIGIVLSPWTNEHQDNQPRAAFVEFSSYLPSASRIPPLITDDVIAQKAPPIFSRWMEKWRPEVILCWNWQVRKWVEQMNLRIPEDIGIAHLGLGESEREWSGIDERNEMLGGAAIDLLSAHLQRNERGIPPFPKMVTIPGKWVDGLTTRSAPENT